MLNKIAAAVGMGILLTIIFASWSPIELRPTTELSLGWEHILAFSVLSTCLGYALPRHTLALLLGLSLIAIILEVGQLFVPGRHARLLDCVTKIGGAGLGLVVARLADMLIARSFGQRREQKARVVPEI